MAYQKVCKQGRDDAWKQWSRVLAKPHPYIFFTLQLAYAMHQSYSYMCLVGSYKIATK